MRSWNLGKLGSSISHRNQRLHSSLPSFHREGAVIQTTVDRHPSSKRAFRQRLRLQRPSRQETHSRRSRKTRQFVHCPQWDKEGTGNSTTRLWHILSRPNHCLDKNSLGFKSIQRTRLSVSQQPLIADRFRL